MNFLEALGGWLRWVSADRFLKGEARRPVVGGRPRELLEDRRRERRRKERVKESGIAVSKLIPVSIKPMV